MKVLILEYIWELCKIFLIGFATCYIWLIIKLIVVGNMSTGIEDLILNWLATFFIYFKFNKRNILNIHEDYKE